MPRNLAMAMMITLGSLYGWNSQCWRCWSVTNQLVKPISLDACLGQSDTVSFSAIFHEYRNWRLKFELCGWIWTRSLETLNIDLGSLALWRSNKTVLEVSWPKPNCPFFSPPESCSSLSRHRGLLRIKPYQVNNKSGCLLWWCLLAEKNENNTLLGFDPWFWYGLEPRCHWPLADIIQVSFARVLRPILRAWSLTIATT